MTIAYLIALALGITAPPFPFLEAVNKACGDDIECVADAIEYARDESGLSENPRPWSHDAKDHTSCGILQLPCRIVEKSDLDAQVTYWARLRSWSLRACHAMPRAEAMAALASGSCDRGRSLSRGRYETAQAALWGVETGLTVAPVPSQP
jgi:hypothetical protein